MDVTRKSLLAAAVFLCFGIAWILLSDTALNNLFPASPDAIQKYQTYKGLLFIVIASIIFFFTFRFFLARQQRLLEESQREKNKYDTLIHDLPLGIYRSNPAGSLLTLNPSTRKLLGIDEAEITLDTWLRMIDEKDRARIRKNWQEAINQKGLFYEEYRIHCRDLRTRHVIEIAHPEYDSDGRLSGYLGTVSDVTDNHEIKSAVTEKENLLQLFVEHSPLPIALFDTEMCYLKASRRWISDFELEDEDLIGKSHYDVFPEILPHWKAIHQRCLGGEHDFREEDLFVRASGKKDYLRWSIFPWYTGAGDIGGIVIFAEVITALVQARKREHNLLDKLRLAISATQVGFGHLNLQTSELFLSPECKKMLGYQDHELSNDLVQWLEMIYNDDREAVHNMLAGAATAADGQNFEIEARLPHRDGTWRSLFWKCRTVPGQNAQGKSLVGAFVDVTRQRSLERAALETKNHLEHLLAASPTVMYALRVEGEKVIPSWISDNLERVLGYTVEEANKADWWLEHLHPQDRSGALNRLRRVLEQAHDSTVYRFQHRQGHTVYLRDDSRLVRDAASGIVEIIGSMSDITEAREQEERMRLYAAALEGTNEGVLVTSLDGTIVSVNAAFTKITGYSEEEVLGRNPRLLQSGRHDHLYYKAMWEHLLKFGSWQGEVQNRRKDGSVYPQLLSISGVRNDSGELTHYMGITMDLSQEKEKEQQLDQLAHFDQLTNLPNQALLTSLLNHTIEQAQRAGQKFAVLLLKISGMAKINESLGHDVGDKLLIQAAERVKKRLRGVDTFGRMADGSFLVCVEDVGNIEGLATLATAVLGIFQKPFSVDDATGIPLTASLGISLYPDDGLTSTELLKNAEIAMRQARRTGRDDFAFFSEEMGAAAVERLELEIALREGMERNELILHYQPKVDLETGKMTSAEALVRWQRPGQGLVPPFKFIPIAENTGLIIPLGEQVLKLACEQLRTWLSEGVRAPAISINVAARQFSRTDLVDIISRYLARYDLDAGHIEVEITESALMEDPEQTITLLSRLQDLGIRISLDDFGTGYSNLSYLARYPVETLKIDASFIHQMHESPNAMKLVNSIIELGHNIGLRTIAEGVETREQLDYLRERGCDAIQGYYFSKPLPADEFEALVREERTLSIH